MSVGNNIKLRRKELGLTQEELALKMGYKSKSAINKIELGVNDISQSKIVHFAEVLGVTPAYIMGWEESQKEKPTDTDELTENKQKLIEFAKSVPEDKVDLILKVMRSILEND